MAYSVKYVSVSVLSSVPCYGTLVSSSYPSVSCKLLARLFLRLIRLFRVSYGTLFSSSYRSVRLFLLSVCLVLITVLLFFGLRSDLLFERRSVGVVRTLC